MARAELIAPVDSGGLANGAVTFPKLAGDIRGVAGIGDPIRSKLVCGFQDDETWAQSNCTLVRDFIAANVKFGDRSLKQTVAASTTGTATCTLTETVDIRSDVGIWVKVDTVANVGALGIFIYADNGAGAPEAGYHRAYFYEATAVNRFGLKDGEWKLVRIPARGPFTAGSSPTDWSSSNPVKTVRKIMLYTYTNAGGAINVHWGSITSLAPERAGLVLMMDDAFSPNGPAVIEPALTSRGWAACTCVCASFIGTENYMTAAQLLALQAKGWDVCSHNRNHTEYTVETATSLVRSDFARGKKLFADKGLFRGPQFLMWPGLAGTSAVDGDTGEYAGDLAKRFFLGCRGWCKFAGVTSYSELYQGKANCWIPQNWYELAYYALYATDNDDFSVAAEPWLDAMVANRMVGFPYTHNIKTSPAAYDNSLAFWAGMLAWLDANVYHPTRNPGGMVDLMTLSQWYNRIVGRPGCIRAGHDGGIYQTDGAGTAKLIG